MSNIQTVGYTGGRKTGFSLRESLQCQGVTSAWSMRFHINFAYFIMQIWGGDITEYRVNKNYPNTL